MPCNRRSQAGPEGIQIQKGPKHSRPNLYVKRKRVSFINLVFLLWSTVKVDREKQEIIVDEKLEDITIDELQESLQSHQPRFIVLSYKREHGDGRVSYPLCFIFFTPRDSHAELQIMYAGSKISLQREADVARAYEIRELEDLTEEWLLEKLGN